MNSYKMNAYKVEFLRNAAEEYCYARTDYMLFAKEYKAAKADGSYYANKAEYETTYWRRYEQDSSAYDKLRDMCALVGADFETVLRVEKSIRRHAQYHHNWDFLPHLGASWRWNDEICGKAGSEASYCKAVSAN